VNPIKTALLLDAQLYAVVQMTLQNVLLVETGHEAVARALFHSFIEMLAKYLAPPLITQALVRPPAEKPATPKAEKPPKPDKPTEPKKDKPAEQPKPSLFEQPSLF
jgi:outer membrane biosynthesis protein TonB